MTRFLARFALIALVLAGAKPAAAQTLVIAARDSAAIVAAPAATVTTALRVTNRSADRASIVPKIEVPAEWSVPMGTQPFALAAGESDSWIVGVRLPARTPAGRYTILVSAEDSASHQIIRDSIAVSVSVVRALELSLTSRPTYSVSGNTYRAVFLLQNRGNVPTTVAVNAKSVLGGTVTLEASQLSIGAGASLPLVVSVATRTKGAEAQDDVVELFAADKSDTSVTATTSSRVTVVQEANTSEPFHRVASQLRLRAANGSAGVSPYEFVGGGALRDGGSEQLSFVLRGSPGASSQFGDQDEYHLELRGSKFTARAGDGLYRISSLSSNGQTGFGGGLDVRYGALGAGAFAQRFRRQPNGPTEAGAYLSARADDIIGRPQFTVSGLSRTGGILSGQVLGSGVTMDPISVVHIEAEVAGSTGPLGRGAAREAHVSGGDRVRYDVAHIAADNQFAGVYRGAEHDYASVSAKATEDLRFSASMGSHQSNGMVLGIMAPQYLRSTTLGMDYTSQFTLQYSSLTRTSNAYTARTDESQRGLLARSEQIFGTTRMWGSAGAGVATSLLGGQHEYHELSLGASANFGLNSLSLYGEASKGMSISRGSDNIITIGGDGRLQVAPGTSLTFNGFQTMLRSSGERFSQLDAGISQQLKTGSTVSLRVRLTGNAYDAREREVAFIEYTMPVQMPIGRVRSAGRVRGRVVDQETGLGVAGTLVRLGPQAAITDAEGNVAFAGLPAGEYRLSLAQRTSQTSVFTGDPTVRVDSTRRTPTTFALAVERAGLVIGSVRQMAVARTGIETTQDSLADAGPLNDVSLALIGVRDTLYATTDATGAYRFTEVASGSYVLKVMSESRTGARWEPAEIEVTVKPAVTRQVAFRSVPRRRAVQMIAPDSNPARK
ncbi:MAG: hypothetical protein ABI969_05735 [bacterium]